MITAIGLFYPILVLWGIQATNLLTKSDVLRPRVFNGKFGEIAFFLLNTMIFLSQFAGAIWILMTFSIGTALLIIGGGLAIGVVSFVLITSLAGIAGTFMFCASALFALHFIAWARSTRNL